MAEPDDRPPKEEEDLDKVDKESLESFPASDPPSSSSPVR